MSRSHALTRIDFLEEDILTHPTPPSAKSMRRWLREAPEGRGFTLMAPETLFGNAHGIATGAQILSEAVTSLSAQAVLFRPPRGHAPSAANREQFHAMIANEAVVSALNGAQIVLVPRGLWDLEVATAVVADTDVVVAFDPLANDPLEEIPAMLAMALEQKIAYLRPGRRATTRRRFDAYELETLADIACELEKGWVSFTHGEKVRDGEALKKLLKDS